MDCIFLIDKALPTVTAVATLVIAIATWVNVRASNRIAKASELTLKAGITPQVVAYLEGHFHDHIVPDVTIVLENIGQGAAQNVKYTIHFEDEAGKKLAKKYFLSNKTDLTIDFMPQGAKREMTLGSTEELHNRDTGLATIAPFRVTVQYENVEGTHYGPRSFPLDVRDFDGTGGVETSSIVVIEKSLKALPKIEQQLQKLGTRG